MTKHFPKPPFKAQPQSIPGRSDKMEPKPDHGETTYRGSNKLKDKKAIITGADSGIGRAVALAFAREGADVLVSYLDAAGPPVTRSVPSFSTLWPSPPLARKSDTATRYVPVGMIGRPSSIMLSVITRSPSGFDASQM